MIIMSNNFPRNNRIIPFVLFVASIITGTFNTNFAQVEFTSSNLPIVIIDTDGVEIVDEPKITATMKIINNANGQRNNITDEPTEYDGYIGIELRGWTSQERFPKKQYAIETREENGDNLNVPLFGMPRENDWVLYAPYTDKSLMRNVLAYHIANETGRYASRTQFCEVIVNGDYLGVFVWMEKIKRDDDRINITRLDSDDLDGNRLTGGYIIRIDKDTTANLNLGWYSNFAPYEGSDKRVFYQYYYPRASDIQPLQANYIQSVVNDFETLMDSENYNTIFNGYYDAIGLNSFVDYFITNEVARNIDAYRLSAYMYKDRDDEDKRLKMGPVWDFNIAFGNADFNDGQFVHGWQVDYKGTSRYQNPFWWRVLFNDPVFENRLKNNWKKLRANKLHTDTLRNYIDGLASLLNEAQQRNFERWLILGEDIWPNYFIGDTYEEEVEYLKDWLTSRMNWMDVNLLSDDNFAYVDWERRSKVELNLNPGEVTKVAKEFFIDSLNNVDSLQFYSSDSALGITDAGDSLVISNNQSGNYYVRGTAWQDDVIVDVSPLYAVNNLVTNVEKELEIPKTFTLYPNYPNPFNGTTTISFSIPKKEYIKIVLYDILGNEVDIVSDDVMRAGYHSISYNANRLSSGVYLIRVESSYNSFIQKILLLK